MDRVIDWRVKAGGGLLLAAAFVWAAWYAWLSGSVITDSWQSLGPVAFAKHPFDLRGSFLGSFDGFDQTWGHHWPGWAMFRSFLQPWIGFHPLFEFALGSAMLVGGAAAVGRLSHHVGGIWPWIAAAVVLAWPDLHVAVGMMRPEPFAGVLFLGLAWLVTDRESAKGGNLLIALLAFCLPFVHVVGVVAPPFLIGVWMLWHRLRWQRMRADGMFVRIVWLMAGWFCGVTGLAVWFLGDATRFHQFTQNLAAQRLSYHSLLTGFRLCYGNPFGMLMLALWMYPLVSLWFGRRESGALKFALWAAMPVGAALFSLLAHNPNRLHVAALVPCMVCACCRSPWNTSRFGKPAFRAVVGGCFVYGAAFQGNRMIDAWRTRGVSARPASQALVERWASQGRVFIPCSLWEAAAAAGVENARFYTFPNVATPDCRRDAERSLFASCANGDILLYEWSQRQVGSAYFRPEALMRLTFVDPLSLGPVLDEVTIQGLDGTRTYRVIRIDHPPVIE
ncbi:hypothetical protein ACFQ5Q_04010 [Luteolibacter ambystomatis]